jgi:O-antigen ligase
LLGVSRYGSAKDKYLYAFGVSYTLCCLIVLVQLLGYNPLGLYPNNLNYYDPFVQETGKFLGTVGNIDLHSALSCLAIPMMCAICVCGSSRRRFLLLIPASLGLASVAASGVASGVLALAVTAVVFVPISVIFLHCRNKGMQAATVVSERSFRRRVVTVAFLAVAAALLAIYFWPGEGDTMSELRSLLHGEISDSYGSRRILIWKNVLNVIKDHPIFGVGSDSLESVLDVRFTRYSEVLGETITAAVDNAHNEYLQLLASFGLFGFLPLMAAQAVTWVHILRYWRISRLITLICPGLLCYLVQAFFNIGLCITTPLFCIFWALTWTGQGMTVSNTGNGNEIPYGDFLCTARIVKKNY